jgi:hypothetical protein
MSQQKLQQAEKAFMSVAQKYADAINANRGVRRLRILADHLTDAYDTLQQARAALAAKEA